MTLPGNGTTKKVIAGIAVGIALLIIGMVLANDKDVAALKVRLEKVEDSQRETRAILEVNRTENRQEHQLIFDKLDDIKDLVIGKSAGAA
jgi:hypothetical protein